MRKIKRKEREGGKWEEDENVKQRRFAGEVEQWPSSQEETNIKQFGLNFSIPVRGRRPAGPRTQLKSTVTQRNVLSLFPEVT